MVVKGWQTKAENMGRRAGEALRLYGTPTKCPFRRDDLVAAWHRGYAAGVSPRP